MDRHLLYGFAMVMALGGCTEAALLPSGGSCVRSTQCVPGLVCVLGQCTTDLSGLEGGVVRLTDGQVELDAADVDADVDAGPIGADSGPMVMVDAGPPVDGGPGMDAGPPMIDAGTDAGPPMIDAGTDAGPPMIDAGTDAGPPASADAG